MYQMDITLGLIKIQGTHPLQHSDIIKLGKTISPGQAQDVHCLVSSVPSFPANRARIRVEVHQELSPAASPKLLPILPSPNCWTSPPFPSLPIIRKICNKNALF